jgi:flagellar motor protein MotB
MDENSQIEKMLLEGAIEVCGIDSTTGEFLYNFTDSFKELYPELYNETQSCFSREIMFLWENRFLSMDITEQNPVVTITEKALDKEEVDKLDPETQTMLKEIIRILFLKNDII